MKMLLNASAMMLALAVIPPAVAADTNAHKPISEQQKIENEKSFAEERAKLRAEMHDKMHACLIAGNCKDIDLPARPPRDYR